MNMLDRIKEAMYERTATGVEPKVIIINEFDIYEAIEEFNRMMPVNSMLSKDVNLTYCGCKVYRSKDCEPGIIIVA